MITNKEKIQLELNIVLLRQELAQYRLDNRYNFTLKPKYWDIVKELKDKLKEQRKCDLKRFETNIVQIEEFKVAYLKKKNIKS